MNLARIPLLLDSSFNIIGEPLHYLTDIIDSKTTKIFTSSMTEQEMNAQMPNEYKSRLPNVLAIIGLSQLKKIDEITKTRIKNSQYLTEELQKINIPTPIIAKNRTHVFLRYTIRTNNNQKTYALFNKHQINLGLWFISRFGFWFRAGG